MSETKGHPKGLYLIFATGTAERFSYYGMRAIFILFLIHALHFDTELASSIYGSYTGLVYLTPLLGGYVADKYWGTRRSIFIGALLMAIGQFFMFLSASVLDMVTMSHLLMYSGLAFIIFGNGFFKPTITTLVGQLYEPDDKRLDAAYTIFYTGVNVGAFFAPLMCGYFGETGDIHDFKWGFLIAAIGILLSILLFETQKNKYLHSPSGKPIGIVPEAKQAKMDLLKENEELLSSPMNRKKVLALLISEVVLFVAFYFLFGGDIVSAGIFATSIAIPIFILFDGSLTKIERDRLIVIFIIAFFVIFFWAAYEQAGASLTIFASEQTERGFDITWLSMHVFYPLQHFFGAISDARLTELTTAGPVIWEMPSSWFQSFNPLFVVALAFIMPALWETLGKHGKEPTSPTKQALGLLLLSLGYLVIAIGVKDLEPGVKSSMMWLTALYFIHTIGEMALSPIGLSMVTKLTPARFASLMMGVWYLSTATANKFAGVLSGLYPEHGEVKHFIGYEIASLYDFFMLFVVMSALSALILFLLSKKLQQMMHGVE